MLFFFNDTATTEIYTLSLHDALPICQFAATNVGEAITQDLFPGTVEKHDATFRVRGDQTPAHGVNDVFGKILQVEQFLTFLFEFASLAAQRLRQQARQIGDSQKTYEVAQEP